MRKTLIISILCLIHASAFASFKDVNWNHLHENAINQLQNKNIVRGYSDGTFKPERFITRAEMLKILVEANFLNKDNSEIDNFKESKCFNDSNPSEWFNKYVCWAKDKQWVSGFNNQTEFRPNKHVTLVEALKLALVSSNIDYAQTDRWYRGVVDKSSDLNLIPIDSVYFHNNITRAQMADLIIRHSEFKNNNLENYLGDKANSVVSFDTLKVRKNLYDELITECKTQTHLRMLSNTVFSFNNPDKDCFSVIKFYTNSLKDLPKDPDLIKGDSKAYYTLFYKTNIKDSQKINELINSITNYEDVDPNQYNQLSSRSQYLNGPGVYFANFPSGFSDFVTEEFPRYYEDDNDLSFEETKQMWKLEAEDRFETISECRNYNFPSVKLFKIATFYEHCKSLGM